VLLYAPGTKSGEEHMSSILRTLGIPYVVPPPPPTTIGSSSPPRRGSSSIVPLPVLRTVLANNGWVLLPVKSSDDLAAASAADPASSDLGGVLVDALDGARGLLADVAASPPASVPPGAAAAAAPAENNGAVLFLGMDSPELPMEEVVYGLRISSSGRGGGPPPPRTNGGAAPMPDGAGGERRGTTPSFAAGSGRAHLCPANDGGYGLLSVPGHAPSSGVFRGVRWSRPLAAMSQLKALTDLGVDVSVGTLMFDVDEPADVRDLAARLIGSSRDDGGGTEGGKSDDLPPPGEGGGGDSLTIPSAGIGSVVPTGARRCFPHHTWRALMDLNVVQGS
jgi:hypothetical protein